MCHYVSIMFALRCYHLGEKSTTMVHSTHSACPHPASRPPSFAALNQPLHVNIPAPMLPQVLGSLIRRSCTRHDGFLFSTYRKSWKSLPVKAIVTLLSPIVLVLYTWGTEPCNDTWMSCIRQDSTRGRQLYLKTGRMPVLLLFYFFVVQESA